MSNQARAFAEKVRDEVLTHQVFQNDLEERRWMAAIEKVLTEYECPDCMYSIAKGHRS